MDVRTGDLVELTGLDLATIQTLLARGYQVVPEKHQAEASRITAQTGRGTVDLGGNSGLATWAAQQRQRQAKGKAKRRRRRKATKHHKQRLRNRRG